MKMSRTKRNVFLSPINIYFGPDDGGAPPAGGGGNPPPPPAGGDPPPPPVPPPAAPKTFNQQQVDDIIKERFKKERTEKEGLLADLKKLQESKIGTEQQQQELSARIEQMETSLRSKEEQAAAQAKTLETKHKKETDALLAERDSWKGRYTSETISRAIQDAAIAAKGLEPAQFVMMFGGQARIEEAKDSDGKPTGRFDTMLKFLGLDSETKKPITMDLPAAEAIAYMRDNNLHSNLFDHSTKPGTGANPSGNGKGKDSSKMPNREDYASDTAFNQAYQTWRDSFNYDGSPIKK